ncbi:hypothetical protein TRIUR3_24563 [Triticum urartu]|uniref:Uncharacterized protein n=1 Tax=Triticum urartu TaxID=4572 RepID=M7ZV70_TRIUA|nr:hypothetical protein TRIUR3_24563 [Triticum urartu]
MAPLVPDAAAGRRRRAAIVRAVGISGEGTSGKRCRSRSCWAPTELSLAGRAMSAVPYQRNSSPDFSADAQCVDGRLGMLGWIKNLRGTGENSDRE